ncbi:MAG TPA: hypothetical protein VGY54_00240 [Polyangiaceae bacterium]|nr:hypothetical protein [Polyangiaceae bacterium]
MPPVTNVLPNGMGTYMAPQHLFAMVGAMGGTTPGEHTVLCNDNPANGWLPLCPHSSNVSDSATQSPTISP